MSWTVVDDGPVIQVRASIDSQAELMDLIASLQKHLTERADETKETEKTNGR